MHIDKINILSKYNDQYMTLNSTVIGSKRVSDFAQDDKHLTMKELDIILSQKHQRCRFASIIDKKRDAKDRRVNVVKIHTLAAGYRRY